MSRLACWPLRLSTGFGLLKRRLPRRPGSVLPAPARGRRACPARERGQSLVELGLLLPVLLVLVLGAIDFGRLYYSYVTVTNSARTGAQYASASTANASNLPGITAAVLQDTTSLQTSPTVTATTGTDASGNTYARVTVGHTFNTIFQWPGIPNSIPLERTVQMRVAP